MNKSDCTRFLQWALPQLHLRWSGFRKVRAQVCKRLQRRLDELALPHLNAYRSYLEHHPQEWSVLDDCCRITISRFYRDRAVFDRLRQDILPSLAQRAIRNDSQLRVWSAGCASGEEPLTLAIIWHFSIQPHFPLLPLRMIATDADAHLLERAERGCYPAGSLKELPTEWQSQAFTQSDEEYCIRPEFQEAIAFHQQDIRQEMPEDTFLLILCRNLAFTYFQLDWQREILQRLQGRLSPGGILLVGRKETLPAEENPMQAVSKPLGIYRR